ncbi:MAG TPA: adenine phosphoribosyltransferase [Candidatus Poseidoniales archaeon]|nr:adenine phosphoribosyltransferase [Candidatus Poseidoniaceae archaeon]RAH12613.1 MAG: adenine phosphoribosyltransferase [Euryarchaeota archaeon]DAC40930.1 MAG TPA: adenine phosphoribosyltransferase [Candidatus Poseidoniales archaeon]HIH57121.1 adenine phosphoribosyltransferase [Candidatus Poseidoniaceae archaeon]
MNLKEHIRGIPDFPIPGILFYDISTLLSNPKAWSFALDELEKIVSEWNPEILAGIESRGFLLASALADRMDLPMTMIRKKGKLPGDVISYEYDLEYGTDIIEIQSDALAAGSKVVILDDLLATGGTLKASIELCEKVGANVIGSAVIIELEFLNGKENMQKTVKSLVKY